MGNLVLHSHSLESDATIDWDRIDRIKSERIFQIQTISGEKFLGQITATETTAGALVVNSGGATRVLQHDDIFLVTETVRGLNGLLKVNVGAGVSLTKSNDQKQWSAQIGASYDTPNYEIGGTFDSLFTTQEAVDDTKRNNLKVDFYRKLPDRWGLAALGGFLNSSAQNLDLRTTVGGGPAYDFVRRQDFVVRATGGAVWVRDQYDPDVVSDPERSEMAGMGGALLSFNRFKQWQLDSSFFVFPSFSSTSGTLLDWRVNLRFRLIHGQRLWWNFTNSIDYNSNPPEGSSGNDYVITTSVTYDFP